MDNARRQLIVCLDGTNNNLTGRRHDTNVSQLCELLDTDANDQLLYYDPGVGNSGNLPGATWYENIKAKYERISGLAFGSGIYENIAEAYRFLMRHWRQGDDIYLFGFSRGAFTARSLGGLVSTFGILRPEMEVMVPTLLHVYFLDRDRNAREYKLIKDQISDLFAGQAGRLAPVWFVGVWDTVASVGAPLPLFHKEITAVPTIVNKRFHHVRQTLALDEFRYTFRPRPYLIEQNYDYAAHQQSMAQEWFAGCHSDVGGGYANEQAGLSQQTLLWMVGQAGSALCGLRIRSALLGIDGLPDNSKIQALLDDKSRAAVTSAASVNPQAAPPATPVRQKVVHSEIYIAPWWALGGMRVRDPGELLDLGRVLQKPPVQSPTVAADALKFPQNTSWQAPRAMRWLLLAALLMLVFMTISGALHLQPKADQAICAMPWDWMNRWPAVFRINICFSNWQMGWVTHLKPPGAGLSAFYSPVWAVIVDFATIASYGYLLARGTGWAFARLARLRTVAMATGASPRPEGATRWLNRLGWAPCAMVLGDVFENLATLAVIWTADSSAMPSLQWPFGVAMTLFALVKWLGLLASLALLGWAVFQRPFKG